MSCATNIHLKLLDFFHFTPSISKPTCPSFFLKQIHLSSSSFPLKTKISPSKIVPFVAQTSDWGQQEEVDNESDEALETNNATDSFAWETKEEKVDSDGGNFEKNYSESPEEAKLFVGNLPFDVDSEKLAHLFDQAGVVEISEVIYNRQTDQSRGFGFVTMSSIEEADKAVEKFNGYDVNGRVLTVNKAGARGSEPDRDRVPRSYEPSFRIYVGNLPWQVDNARLEKVFSQHGRVVDAKVVNDHETGRSRGFGFVTMSTEMELNDAIAALDGQNMDGRVLKVNAAQEKPRRGF